MPADRVPEVSSLDDGALDNGALDEAALDDRAVGGTLLGAIVLEDEVPGDRLPEEGGPDDWWPADPPAGGPNVNVLIGVQALISSWIKAAWDFAGSVPDPPGWPPFPALFRTPIPPGPPCPALSPVPRWPPEAVGSATMPVNKVSIAA